MTTQYDDPAEWAENVLVQALVDSKTRLKAIRADDKLELEVLDAIVTVAGAKATSYAKAHSGQLSVADSAQVLHGWIHRDRPLADALRTLSGVGIQASDVPMLPGVFS